MVSIIRASLFLTIASIAGRASVVLAGIFVARNFGTEAFALFTFVHVTATSVSNIAMLGMMNGLPRFIAQMQSDPSDDALARALIAVAVVGLGLTIATAALALVPAEIIGLPDPERGGVLLALTLTIGLNNLLIGVNNGLEQFSRVTLGTLAMGAVLMGGIAMATVLHVPTISLLVYLLATLISIFLLLPYPVKAFRSRLAQKTIDLSGRNIRAVGTYVGPMFLATILTNTGLWIGGRSLLGSNGGTQAFAEFALGQQWFGLAQMASVVVAKVIMPRLTRNVYQSNKNDQRATMRTAIVMSVGGALVVMTGVLISRPLILKLYGSTLTDAHLPLLIFVLAAVVASPINAVQSAMVAEGRYLHILAATFMWWLTLVGGATLFGKDGAAAMCLVTLFSYFIFTLAMVKLSASKISAR